MFLTKQELKHWLKKEYGKGYTIINSKDISRTCPPIRYFDRTCLCEEYVQIFDEIGNCERTIYGFKPVQNGMLVLYDV
jgi:hypothetical protein